MSNREKDPRDEGGNMLLNLKQAEQACLESALYAWSQGQTLCPEAPQIIYLCPTNVCNHRCCTCGYDSMRRGRKPDGSPQRGYMDMDLYRKIVSELPRGFRRLYLQKTGESLLHPHIVEMMRILKNERPEYDRAIHTNASVLTPEIAEALLENMTFVSLSIFAFDAETYALAHGADHFERVMRNIEMFHDAWARADNPPKVYFDVVRNAHISRLRDEDIFRVLREKFPNFNVGIHFPFNFQGFVKEYDNKIFSRIDLKRMPTCIHPWDMMAIYWDGVVGYCVGDPQESANLGNLREQTVMEAWNGEQYREFRRLLLKKEYPALREKGIHCGTCNWNFALKSQVLTNLCMHARQDERIQGKAAAGHLVTGRDMLHAALLSYARGDIAKALKDATFAEIVAEDPLVRQSAAKWKERVVDVLSMRRNLEYWENLLAQEGLSLSLVHISHYAVAQAQEETTGDKHCRGGGGELLKKDAF